MFKRILKRYRRWRYRRAYNKLSPGWQRVIRYLREDPDSKIERGEL